MKKKLLVAVLAGLVAAAIVAPAPAQANPFVGAADCTVTLAWPGSGSADCNGSAFGVDVGGGATCVPPTGCTFNAHANVYGEECVASEPPLVGTASGTLSISGSQVGTFSWTRVGVVAVLLPVVDGSSSAGVAAFAPQGTSLPTCADPGTLTARIIGIAAVL